MTFVVEKSYNIAKQRYEFVCTNGHRYVHSYTKEEYGKDREDLLIFWFNKILVQLDDKETSPSQQT